MLLTPRVSIFECGGGRGMVEVCIDGELNLSTLSAEVTKKKTVGDRK